MAYSVFPSFIQSMFTMIFSWLFLHGARSLSPHQVSFFFNNNLMPLKLWLNLYFITADILCMY